MVYGFSKTDKSKHDLGDHTFSIPVSAWVANTDIYTNDIYPYVANIATTIYSNDSKPIGQINGVGDIPTAEELESIALVQDGKVTSTGIILYATDTPLLPLVLELKGV